MVYSNINIYLVQECTYYHIVIAITVNCRLIFNNKVTNQTRGESLTIQITSILNFDSAIIVFVVFELIFLSIKD